MRMFVVITILAIPSQNNFASYIVFSYYFVIMISADASFDWVVITSPEAGLVFLEAWKYVFEVFDKIMSILNMSSSLNFLSKI